VKLRELSGANSEEWVVIGFYMHADGLNSRGHSICGELNIRVGQWNSIVHRVTTGGIDGLISDHQRELFLTFANLIQLVVDE